MLGTYSMAILDSLGLFDQMNNGAPSRCTKVLLTCPLRFRHGGGGGPAIARISDIAIRDELRALSSAYTYVHSNFVLS